MISYEKLAFSSWVKDRLLTPEGEAYEKKTWHRKLENFDLNSSQRSDQGKTNLALRPAPITHDKLLYLGPIILFQEF